MASACWRIIILLLNHDESIPRQEQPKSTIVMQITCFGLSFWTCSHKQVHVARPFDRPSCILSEEQTVHVSNKIPLVIDHGDFSQENTPQGYNAGVNCN